MKQTMDIKLFKSIGEVPNARETWNFISDAVVSDLIGEDVFSLQHIEHGSRYRLGDVVVKEEKSMKDRRIFRKVPKAIRAGHLSTFLNPSDKERDQAIYSFQSQYRNADLDPNFVWAKETSSKGTTKSIRVEVVGCKEVYLTHIPDENSLLRSLNKGFLDFFTKFHLVSTIYRARKVRVQVKINHQTDEFVTSCPDWTVGFKLHRYNLDDMKTPTEKSPKNLKIRFMSWFLFPGFTTDRQPPPNNGQKSEMRERGGDRRVNVRARKVGAHK